MPPPEVVAPVARGRRILRLHGEGVPPVARRELVAWAFYDFANSGYTTVVITAVFNAYFVAVVAGKATWATLAWTAALAISYGANVLSAPLIGAWADLRARKRELLWASSALCVVATAALAGCGPGMVLPALVLIVVSNYAFGMGENLIAAFLPELADDEALGRVSGWGWALGYLGGLLVLAICLAWIQGAGARGADTGTAVAQTMLITAAAFALTAWPALAILRERARPTAVQPGEIARLALQRVRGEFSGSRGLVELRRFLACIVCYQAGVQTVIALAAIYTQEALGFTTEDSIRLILLVNVTAAAGAFAFGFVQDRLGHRLTLALTLAGWLCAVGLLWAATDRSMVWLAANVAGLCLGASQSAGRALVGYLCPRGREAEVFGLWGLAVKLASILGPLSYGLVSWTTGGDHRKAVLVTAAFFVGGLLLLLRVDVAGGRQRVLASGDGTAR
ncbi:MAG TPA: MFS transporter [Pseudomonadota bacterium]|nr:MFS transporter [Xanthomonadales bacterium]HQX24669.1 MFS transporter [Pseudomonadota bacterium]HQY36210.1 MFS transporter [Pseudomonadota bacterium]HRA37008.1 MFS transporter [Pseudomonadota bacterium]